MASLLTLEEYSEACRQQGITLSLHPWYVNLLEAANSLGSTIMRQPALRYLDCPIDEEPFRHDGVALALTRMLNATVQSPKSRPGEVKLTTSYASEVDDCSQADIYFAGTLHRMRTNKPWSYQIFTHGGEPVLLRKMYGEKSVLSLVPVSLGWQADRHIPFPAGALFSVRIRGEDLSSSVTQEVVPVDALRGMSFLRLTPWALPPEQRTEVYSNRIARATTEERALLLGAVATPLQIVCDALAARVQLDT